MISDVVLLVSVGGRIFMYRSMFGHVLYSVIKIVPTGDWGHLLTLTLTSDDLKSYRRECLIDL